MRTPKAIWDRYPGDWFEKELPQIVSITRQRTGIDLRNRRYDNKNRKDADIPLHSIGSIRREDPRAVSRLEPHLIRGWKVPQRSDEKVRQKSDMYRRSHMLLVRVRFNEINASRVHSWFMALRGCRENDPEAQGQNGIV